jgi:hypothetical protein
LASFSILVNTTDSFEDCWIPFFSLFKKFWPGFDGVIYLNTETKNFSFAGLNIISVQNNLNTPGDTPAWSECLVRALNSIPESIILYMHEDYFLHDFVKNDLINEFATLISTNSIDCIHLTDQATPGPFHKSYYKGLLEIDKKAPYRISTQAALWRRDVLKQYIREHESAWQFEHYATKRAWILKHNLFNVDTNTYRKDQNEIIPYILTGVIRGKWNKEVVNLFMSNDLIPDYPIRGFYEIGPIEENKKGNRNYLSLFSKILKSEIGLMKLKICQN